MTRITKPKKVLHSSYPCLLLLLQKKLKASSLKLGLELQVSTVNSATDNSDKGGRWARGKWDGHAASHFLLLESSITLELKDSLHTHLLLPTKPTQNQRRDSPLGGPLGTVPKVTQLVTLSKSAGNSSIFFSIQGWFKREHEIAWYYLKDWQKILHFKKSVQLEIIILSKVSQKDKDKYHMTWLIHGI